jgi:hypothetical protein
MTEEVSARAHLRKLSPILELYARAHLAGAGAAKIGWPGARDLTNARAVDRQHRIREIQVIQRLGDGSQILDFTPVLHAPDSSKNPSVSHGQTGVEHQIVKKIEFDGR